MPSTELSLDGIDAYASYPEGHGPFRAVVLLQDGLGVRPALRQMADRLAGHGYYVVLPNLYWRLGELPPFDPAATFAGGPDGEEMKRLLGYLQRTPEDQASEDVGAVLDHLEREDIVAGPRYGLIGYCMGGGLALRAACDHARRIAVAISVHGGRFQVEPGSIPAISSRFRCEAYLAVAEQDRRHDAAVTERLNQAFTAAGVPHEIELYPGVAHGFAVPDLPPYNEAAAERHWERSLAVLARHLT